MTMMSNLPRDLLEEILSRAPTDSMRAVRLTCKKWNTLAEEESFRKKQLLLAKAAKEFMHQSPQGRRRYKLKCNGKLINLTDVSQVFHCGGLVCITNGFSNTRDVLWNPYWGQTRWIEARSRHAYIYAIGYETKKSCRSYKIVTSANYYIDDKRVGYEIYELDSNSWRVLDLNSDWATAFYKMEVSVKEILIRILEQEVGVNSCFVLILQQRDLDRLCLCHSTLIVKILWLSLVLEKSNLQCYISDMIHYIWRYGLLPNDVSWRKLLLAVDMKPLTVCYGNFFVDEEKKVAVVFDKDKEIRHQSACFLVGCSYVPSSVQIKQLSKGKSN
ncbi:hypothetical protein ARALYDRAFT_318453 [Arabidopsis lyrata subsp. lyrata]|uniref:F-box domain-containing protein n=1 Tax=Arabidopsis lyrata subsp. lyrata TaxID=81972 RepID=D7L686_ARALL|nr:hypothetical protein ARALYDRAFT_318453 [Arabidopsis lyrata subsp. lyrata]